MNLHHRHVRVAAAVGAVIAAGTTTFLALTAGTASADEPGRCTQNVNVREDPDSDAKIVALCEAGKAVKLGEERDGFVRLDELNGWAAKDFLKSDGDAASTEQSADADQPDANGSADGGQSNDGQSNDGQSTDAQSNDAPSDARSADAPSDNARSGDANDSADAHSGSAGQGDDQGTAPTGGARGLGGLLG